MSAAAPTSEKGRGWKRLLKNEAMARESPMNLPVGKGVCGSYGAFFCLTKIYNTLMGKYKKCLVTEKYNGETLT